MPASGAGRMHKARLLIFIVAYHAEATIDQVLRRIPAALADEYDVEILIIDDASQDETFATGVATSRTAGLPFKVTVLYNPVNQGYGGNQKIGYHYAIERGFDYVALLHGDGQYAPECLPELMSPFRTAAADAVFGSRMMLPGAARKGGMPGYKWIGNRILSTIQNRLLGTSLTEFHSGYRIYRTSALREIPFERNTNDFHFDTEIIIQLVFARKRIVEHPIPTYYGDEICRVNGIRYAKDVVKVSLQASLQKFHLFYDRRFDCEPAEARSRYPSKLEFDSTHSQIFDLVPIGSRVLELGSGSGALGAALKRQKNCRVMGVDAERGEMTAVYDRFVTADLNRGLPDLRGQTFDFVLALDVIDRLDNPEHFLDELRELTATWPEAKLIAATGNVGFILTRLALLFGRFEYARRGILDLSHSRLFTFNTLRRAMRSAGFVIEQMEGVVPPLPFIFGSSIVGRTCMAVARKLVRFSPRLFGFQCLIVARPRPTLHALLTWAYAAAAEQHAKAA
jgi:glycosyltransferase involved in cell wall biosynthesis